MGRRESVEELVLLASQEIKPSHHVIVNMDVGIEVHAEVRHFLVDIEQRISGWGGFDGADGFCGFIDDRVGGFCRRGFIDDRVGGFSRLGGFGQRRELGNPVRLDAINVLLIARLALTRDQLLEESLILCSGPLFESLGPDMSGMLEDHEVGVIWVGVAENVVVKLMTESAEEVAAVGASIAESLLDIGTIQIEPDFVKVLGMDSIAIGVVASQGIVCVMSAKMTGKPGALGGVIHQADELIERNLGV